MVREPDTGLVLVVAVGAAALQALEQTRHPDHGTHDPDTGEPKPHGDRAHQAREEERSRATR